MVLNLPADRVRPLSALPCLCVFCCSGSVAVRLAAKELASVRHSSCYNLNFCSPAVFIFKTVRTVGSCRLFCLNKMVVLTNNNEEQDYM